MVHSQREVALDQIVQTLVYHGYQSVIDLSVHFSREQHDSEVN